MWWYNTIFMPLGVLFQHRLNLTTDLQQAETADEILLVCRKVNTDEASR
jgi:hypothetical protein